MRPIIVVIFLWATLVNAKFLQDKKIKPSEWAFPSDPNCGILRSKVNYTNWREFDNLFLPWMISVTSKYDGQHLCDGVLIYPDVLATSAHCVEDYINELMVTAKTTVGVPKHLRPKDYDREVSAVHLNPEYKACSRSNNLAILILSRPFELDEYVNVACLPFSGEQFSMKNCVMRLMEDQRRLDQEWYSGRCGGQTFRAPKSSDLIEEASCQQGHGTPALIKLTHSYTMSCVSSRTSNKFYYLGSKIYIRMCGSNKAYGITDSLLKFMPWINKVVENRDIQPDIDVRFGLD